MKRSRLNEVLLTEGNSETARQPGHGGAVIVPLWQRTGRQHA